MGIFAVLLYLSYLLCTDLVCMKMNYMSLFHLVCMPIHIICSFWMHIICSFHWSLKDTSKKLISERLRKDDSATIEISSDFRILGTLPFHLACQKFERERNPTYEMDLWTEMDSTLFFICNWFIYFNCYTYKTMLDKKDKS